MAAHRYREQCTWFLISNIYDKADETRVAIYEIVR